MPHLSLPLAPRAGLSLSPNGRRGAKLSQHRFRGWDDAGDDHLFAVEAIGNARRDLGLPVVGVVDRLVERLALGLVLEAADPDIFAVVGLAAEAAADHHALRDLKGDDLLLHDLDPFVHLAGAHVVLAQFVKGHGFPPRVNRENSSVFARSNTTPARARDGAVDQPSAASGACRCRKNWFSG